MPFVRTRDYKNIIQTVKVEIGTLLGQEKDEDVYVVFKEPTTEISLHLRKATEKGEEEVLSCFAENLSKLIVEHNLYETEKDLMSNEAVSELLLEKTEIFSKIASSYTETVFHSRPNQAEGK